MATPVWIVGVGPGSRDYIVPLAMKTIRSAEVLVGGQRLLDLFPEIKCAKKTIKNNLEECIEYIAAMQKEGKRVVVLVSGDPGFYSFLHIILQYIPREELEIIPGISSMQLAFSRIKHTWEDARFVSLHGRPIDELDRHLDHAKLAILTDYTNTPASIASYLVKKGRSKDRAFICQDLSFATEKINSTTVGQMQEIDTKLPCVVVINSVDG